MPITPAGGRAGAGLVIADVPVVLPAPRIAGWLKITGADDRLMASMEVR